MMSSKLLDNKYFIIFIKITCVLAFILVVIYDNGQIHYCACVHNLDEASCSACLSMKHHIVTIGQCTHNVMHPLNYDSHLVGQICDFGSVNESHPVANTVNDTVYYCKQCHAVCCSGCYTG